MTLDKVLKLSLFTILTYGLLGCNSENDKKYPVDCDSLIYKGNLAYYKNKDTEEVALYTGECSKQIPYSVESNGITQYYPFGIAWQEYYKSGYDNGELLYSMLLPIIIDDYQTWGIFETYIGPKNRTTNKNNGLYRKYRIEGGKKLDQMQIEFEAECDGSSLIDCEAKFTPERVDNYYSKIVMKFLWK